MASGLRNFGDSPAVMVGERVISYRAFADLVEDFAARLGPRRLVLLAADNSLESLVAYVAALQAGQPLLLVQADAPAAVAALVGAYDPDVIVRTGPEGLTLEEVRPVTRHELHPELALLLSTSGSTGSPKLVRLSQDNLQSNAQSIAEYLGIGSGDRAMTTLPMHYCYGLSVINSHLLRGACLILTDLSVVDACFWQVFRDRGATSFAAVPYTFELLDRAGFVDMELPTLRYMTQAGGRLHPETVRRYARLGAARGWDLYVMYGQTEATARMAYLPPDQAIENADAIGVAVPGGSFRIDPVPGSEDGELVYTGPNVMLGYAAAPADLATGRTVDELRTGDLARRKANGLFQIVGRRSRFVKIVGLRLDLGQVETKLADLGVAAAASGTDDRLVVAVEGEDDPQLLRKFLAQELKLPRTAIAVHAVAQLPRRPTGKVDYPAVLALGAAPTQEPVLHGAEARKPPEDVRTIYAQTLERDDVADEDTFVSLGGDSLSYVAASIRLESAFAGAVPANWHVTPVRELNRLRTAGSGRRALAAMDTSIVLRAIAILTIVSTHVELIHWPGTAHVLMALAGFNFARFQLDGDRVPRLRRHLASVARVVVPTVVFIAAVMLVTDRYHYTTANLLLMNTAIGPESWTDAWHFWFVEVLVYVLVAVMALLAIPRVHRAERRFPFGFPVVLIGLGLLARYEVIGVDVLHTRPVLWLFAIGWALAKASTWRHRLGVCVVTAVALPGYFGDPWREATIFAGIALLAWLPTLPVPALLHRPLGLLATASLYIYVTHWVVFQDIRDLNPWLAVAASVAAGLLYWATVAKAGAFLQQRRRAGVRRGRKPLPLPAAEIKT